MGPVDSDCMRKFNQLSREQRRWIIIELYTDGKCEIDESEFKDVPDLDPDEQQEAEEVARRMLGA